MTEDFTTEAFSYLLNELDPVRRAEFEARLSRDSDAREVLKTCADSIAEFACQSAPAEDLPRAAQRQTLDAIMNAIAAEKTDSVRRLPRFKNFWRSGFWPVAAAVLIALNFLQLAHPFSSAAKSEKNSPAGKSAIPAVIDQRATQDGSTAPGTAESISSNRENSPTPGVESEIKKELNRLETLKNEYAELERERTALRTEYEEVLRQLAARAAAGKGVGHLASMELVDPASFARGDRKGLVNLARDLLTQPGIVAIEPVSPPSKPTGNGQVPPPPAREDPVPISPGDAAATFSARIQTLMPSDSNTVPTTGHLPPTSPPTPSPNPPTATPVPQSAPETAVPQATFPYAWSLFDETEGRGYLNLYNLPPVGQDQTLQLWTKSTPSDSYHLVGPVPPQLYGGSGSVSYTTPGALLAPVEVLITQEPSKTTPTQPSGPVVLRGP